MSVYKPQKTEEERPKISVKDFVLMLVVAIFFDVTLGLIQLIPFVGSIAASVFGVIPFTGFFIWYKLLGLDFKKPKRALTFLGCSLIEFIPVLNALPGWTFEVIVMYILQIKELISKKLIVVVTGIRTKNTGIKNFRSNVSTAQNTKNQIVGGEIIQNTQRKTIEPNNIVHLQPLKDESTRNISQFPIQKNKTEHSKDWVFPRDKVA